MTKRVLSVLLALCLVLGMVPVFASAAVVDSGTCGDNLTWTFDGTTLTISGTGPMYQYDNPWGGGAVSPWVGQEYQDQIKKVIINRGITSITNYAFMWCENLISITIPDGVTSIGRDAFQVCSSLTSITIPNSVTSIGDYAFAGCDALKEVHYSGTQDQWKKISIDKWSNDELLLFASIHCEDGTIEPEPISGTCDKNLTWKLENGTLTISGDGPMYHQYGDPWEGGAVPPWAEQGYRGQIKKVIINRGVTSISSWTFAHCLNLTSVEIPNSVTSIGEGAFSTCVSLASMTIPDSVTSIGGSTFAGCSSLISIDIPSSVTYIAGDALDGCTGLTNINISSDNSTYTTNNGVMFTKDMETLILYPASRTLSSYTIPDGVTSIGPRAFYYSFRLTSITIPRSVSSVGDYAFAQCRGLRDVYYSGTKEQWDEISISDLFQYNFYLVAATIHCTDGIINEKQEEKPTPTPSTNPTFSDVPANAYYAAPVAWAIGKGITKGTGKNTFSPEAKVKRQDVVTFLWRANGKPEPKTTKNPFTDIKEGDYYYKAVLWAVEKKITTGTGKNTFSPAKVCTRKEVATFLWRDAGKPTPKTAKNPFKDVKEGDYYYKAVLWAVEEKITTGTGKNTFSPGNDCTRGQSVTFLYRAIN